MLDHKDETGRLDPNNIREHFVEWGNEFQSFGTDPENGRELNTS